MEGSGNLHNAYAYPGYPHGTRKRVMNEVCHRHPVIMRVSEVAGIPYSEVVGKSRKKKIITARQVSQFIMHKLQGMSSVRVGMFFKAGDHATILHNCRIIETDLEVNKDRIEKYLELIEEFKK